MKNTLTIPQHNSEQQSTEGGYELFLSLPVDDALAVHTAYQQGYEWCFDVGKYSPPEILAVAISLVKHKGYKIGCARVRWFHRTEQDKGLYKPLPKENQQKKKHWNFHF